MTDTHDQSEPVRLEGLGPVLRFMRVLWGLDHSLQMASKRMEARLGITGPQRLVLRLVGRFPGISAGDLASLQQVHPSTLTGVLRRLQERGLLRRRPDPSDARRALLTLTPKGTKVNGRKAATVEESVEHMLQRLDPSAIAVAEGVLAELIADLHPSDEKPKSEAVSKRRAVPAEK